MIFDIINSLSLRRIGYGRSELFMRGAFATPVVTGSRR